MTTRISCSGNCGNFRTCEHETADNVRIEPCFSPVWDTAIVTICLRESGVPENHPALKKAADWLMDKEIRFRRRLDP